MPQLSQFKRFLPNQPDLMPILHLDLKPIQADAVELRSFWDNPNDYVSRSLSLSEIEPLIQQAEKEYYGSPRSQIGKARKLSLVEDEELAQGQSSLVMMGRRLFQWLDGSDRWLVSKFMQHSGEPIGLAIATAGKLAHLPWELLHDGGQFIVQRMPAIVPLRWQSSDSVTRLEPESSPPPNRALNLLLMATSPRDVSPILDYEQEEAQILTVTARTTIGLTVEESGCLEELGELVASQERGFFDAVHLTGHATIREGESFFITETPTGEAHFATAREIAQALKSPLPKLIFLSGCHTGQSANGGAVPSMAEQLLSCGATAVLGWGQPVLDSEATAAAATLYEVLSRGRSLTEALAETYQALIKQKAQDWHLLRLYAAQKLPDSLVKPSGTKGWKRAPKPSIATEFLDPITKQIKVPTRESFVGRRRQLQNCLRAMTPPSETIAVLIHAMGGLGKSSLAARLCDRLPQYLGNQLERLVWQGQIDQARLVNRLSEVRGIDRELRDQLRDPKEELRYRLRDLFEQLETQGKPPFLLVLDDFEANLDAQETTYVLKSPAVEVLNALGWAIESSNLPHRLLLTCRYDFELPDALQRQGLVYRQPLDSFQGADLRKKCSRLSALKSAPLQLNEFAETPIDPQLQLQQKTLQLADGNPRLLETLHNEILVKETIDRAAELEQLEADPAILRNKVLEQRVLEQMEAGLRSVLSRGLVFELPVPREAFEAVTCPSDAPLTETEIDRAIALGLLEVSPEGLVRVPRILPLSLPEDVEPLYGEGARSLYRVWWQEGQDRTEAEALEIHRLALLAQNQDIAAELGASLAHDWCNQSRFREAVALSEQTIAVAPDYRVFHSLARSQEPLGAVQAASAHYAKALAACPEEDQQEKATILHNSAGIHALQGQVEQAIELYQQSLAAEESIGDVQGKAATLHCMAIIYAQQGQVAQAIELYQQSLALQESIGDVQGKAATLNNLAGIYAQQGQVAQAIELYQQSLAAEESIGNVQGKAATLHQLAGIYAQQGQVAQAIELYQQSLALCESIGNVQGKAATLHQLAGIYAQQGQVEQAIELYQQSLALYESIGNVQGKAATLNNLAEIAYQQGETEKALDLLRQTAEALGQARAFVDLVTVLGNLGVADTSNSLSYLAQALWLALNIQVPFADLFVLLRHFFNQLPKGDPLEPLLATTACHLTLNQAAETPDLEQLQQQAWQMLGYVAQSQGIETQEALQTWMADNQLNDPNFFLPQLRQRLEAIVGDTWLFDRSVFDR